MDDARVAALQRDVAAARHEAHELHPAPRPLRRQHRLEGDIVRVQTLAEKTRAFHAAGGCLLEGLPDDDTLIRIAQALSSAVDTEQL